MAHWPHHHLDVGPCQLVVTSPDHRIRIGWLGDDHDTWLISAAEDPVSASRWTVDGGQTAAFRVRAAVELVDSVAHLAQELFGSVPDARLAELPGDQVMR